MKSLTKAAFGSLAVAGSVMAFSAPASAQSVYFGYDSGGGAYGGYYDSDPYAGSYDPYYDAYGSTYDDPYACSYYDYYDAPWGYPSDYCNYQTWNEPVYYGGLWYGGPIYYRTYAGANWFWLNGGWRRDEWRGSRPGYIDWGRNRYWRSELHHRPNSRGVWNGRQWDGRGFAGGNYDRRDGRGYGYGRDGNRGGFDGRAGDRFEGRSFNGGNAFAGRNYNGNDGNRGGGDRGRDFGNRNNGQNFTPPQNNGGDRGGVQRGGESRGRVGGDFGNRGGSAQPNVSPPAGGNPFPNTGRFFGRAGEDGRVERSNAPANSGFRGRFGGQAFQAGGPQAGAGTQAGAGPQAGAQGGPQGGPQGGANRGERDGGERGGGDRGGESGRHRGN